MLDFGCSHITGALKPAHLELILNALVTQGKATWDPPKQTRAVMLLWRSVDEWAEALFDWVRVVSSFSECHYHRSSST